MLGKFSKLGEAKIICCENEEENLYWRKPNPELYANIPMLWNILNLTVQDWFREVEPFQFKIDKAATQNDKYYYLGKSFLELPPYYFKCLFSYVMFFVSLEKAYNLFYEELKALNRLDVFNLKHRKRPARNNYIEKVVSVRNISIAHIGSKDVPSIDAKAGMKWQPLMLKGKDATLNLNRLAFGSGKLIVRDSAGNITNQSIDLEIQGIPDLHNQCIDYLY